MLPVRFSPPLIGERVIQRPHITDTINDMASRGIVFVCAPAGFGKTTVCTLWLASRKKAGAWLSLDEFSSSAQSVYKGILQALSIEGTNDIITPEHLMEQLDKLKRFPTALVIDDFHLCTDEAVAGTLISVRRRLPPQTALVILSRNPPPMVFKEELLRGTVNVLTGLNFRTDEIERLFEQNKISVSTRDAEVLKRQTDGWAAALTTVITAGKDKVSGVINHDLLDDYLRAHVFPYREHYDIFKKCSICDSLTQDLCIAICGRSDAWDIITGFSERTGLVAKFRGNAYRFHSLMKDFLYKELNADDSIDKPALHLISAKWYKEHGELLLALSAAAKSENLSIAEEFLCFYQNEYGTLLADVVEVSAGVMELLSTIPAEMLKKSPRFAATCLWGYFCFGEAERAYEWFDILDAQMENGLVTERNDVIMSALYLSMDMRRDPWNIVRQFKRIATSLPAEQQEKGTAFSLTINFPFFHKAQVDYSEIFPQIGNFAAEASRYMTPVLGAAFQPLMGLITAGMHYEMGEFVQAEGICAALMQSVQFFPPELGFCCYMLSAEIARAQGKEFAEILADTRAMLTAANTPFLLPNLDAYETSAKLSNGDMDAANAWLETRQAELTERPKLHKAHRYLTTARALIVTDRLHDAVKLLDNLALFAETYRRGCDLVEILTLKAVCLWRMRDKSGSAEALAVAINRAIPSALVMPIARAGADVLPVLQYIQGRIKHGYDTYVSDKAFVGVLLSNARSVLDYEKGMFPEREEGSAALSPKQWEMLKFLSEGMTYQEIGVKTGTKITTVRDHISKLYGKLGVTSSADAIRLGKKQGLI